MVGKGPAGCDSDSSSAPAQLVGISRLQEFIPDDEGAFTGIARPRDGSSRR